MKRMGIPKRLLWIWETICCGLAVGYMLKIIFYEVSAVDDRVAIFCAPTVLFMVTLGDAVYTDKIKWSKIQPHQWILPLLIFMGYGVYGLFKSWFVFSMAAGIFITYVLVIIIALSSRISKK